MLKKLLLLPTLLIAFAAQAQTPTLEVVSATPASGTAGVSADETVLVTFTFNEPIDSAHHALDLMTISADVQIDTAYLSADKKTVTFETLHQPDTDYLWIAAGSYVVDLPCDPVLGELDEIVELKRPFVLQYSTAADVGAYSVSGTASIQAGAGKASISMEPLNLSGLRSLSPRTASARAVSSPSTATLQATARQAGLKTARPVAGQSAAQAAELDGSIVLLIDAENPIADLESGSVLAAAVVGSDGSYEINHVRPGTYVTVAVSNLDIDLTSLLGLFDIFTEFVVGTYDTADAGDEPDPIVITTADATGIDITMRPASAYAVGSAKAEADAKAFVEAMAGGTGAQLLGISSLAADMDGNAAFWTIDLTVPESLEEQQVTVTRQAFLTYIEGEPDTYDPATRPIPTGYPTSAEVLTTLSANATAQAFLDANASADTWVTLSAGDPYLAADPIAFIQDDKMMWRVVIMAFGTTVDLLGGNALAAYVDLETGEVVDVQTYPAEAFTYEATAKNAALKVYAPATEIDLYNVFASGVNAEDGTASFWTYSYTSNGTFVSVPMTASLFSFWFPVPFPLDAPGPVPAIPETPSSLVDALALADEQTGAEVRATFGDNYTISVEGGYPTGLITLQPDVLTTVPELATTPVWVITYDAFDVDSDVCNATTATAITIIDMETGEYIAEIAVEGIVLPNEPGDEVSDEVTLGASFPNPFRGETVIPFSLVKAGQATLKVYNVLGQEVATLVNGVLPAGEQSARWNAAGLPSGVYFLRLTVDGATHTQKVVLQR